MKHTSAFSTIATSVGVTLLASGLPNVDVMMCTTQANLPETHSVQQDGLPQQIEARSILEVRVLFKDSSQDQGGAGACGFYCDSLLQLGFPGVVVQDLNHSTFKSFVPLPQDIVVNQDERKVWKIEGGGARVSKQERGFSDAFISQCCHLFQEMMKHQIMDIAVHEKATYGKALVYDDFLYPTSSVLSEKSMEGMFSKGRARCKTTITTLVG